MWKILKTRAIKQILLNNDMLKFSNKYPKTRRDVSPNLTVKTTSLTYFLSI